MSDSDNAAEPVVHVDSGETANGGLDLPPGTQKSDEAQAERENAKFEYNGDDVESPGTETV